MCEERRLFIESQPVALLIILFCQQLFDLGLDFMKRYLYNSASVTTPPAPPEADVFHLVDRSLSSESSLCILLDREIMHLEPFVTGVGKRL